MAKAVMPNTHTLCTHRLAGITHTLLGAHPVMGVCGCVPLVYHQRLRIDEDFGWQGTPSAESSLAVARGAAQHGFLRPFVSLLISSGGG